MSFVVYQVPASNQPICFASFHLHAARAEPSPTLDSILKLATAAINSSATSSSISLSTQSPTLEEVKPILALPPSKELPAFKSLREFWRSPQLPGARLLAHIMGDRFIKDSDLEGSQLKYTASALLTLLSALELHFGQELNKKQLQDLIQRLQPLLKQLSEFEEQLSKVQDCCDYKQLRHLADEWSKRALKLSPGECLLLPGGYKGRPAGHLMIYKLERQADSTFRFTIYNSGDGAEILATFTPNGVRLKVPYRQQFHTIPESHLKTSTARPGEGFLLLLLEPLFLPLLSGDRSVSYTGASIYLNLLQSLQGDAPQHDQSEQGKGVGYELGSFHNAQIAGNCAWKSLMALLRELVPDSSSYKQIVTGLKLYATVAAYQSVLPILHADSREGRAACELLHEAARALTLHGAHRASLYTGEAKAAPCPSLYCQAQVTGVILQELLQKKIEGADGARSLNTTQLELLRPQERAKLLKTLLTALTPPTRPKAGSIATPSDPLFETLKQAPLPKVLHTLEKWLRAMVQGAPCETHSVCDLLVRAFNEKLLPLPRIDSTEWTKESAPECLGLLKRILGHLTTGQMRRKQAPSVRSSYLAIALFTICDHLACQIDPRLKHYPVIDALALRAKDPYELILDPFSFKLASQIDPYLQERNRSAQNRYTALFELPKLAYCTFPVGETSEQSEIHFLFHHFKSQEVDERERIRELLSAPLSCETGSSVYEKQQLGYLYDLRTSALTCQLFLGTLSFDQLNLPNSAALPCFESYFEYENISRTTAKSTVYTNLFIDKKYSNLSYQLFYPTRGRYYNTANGLDWKEPSPFSYYSTHPKSQQPLEPLVEDPPFFSRTLLSGPSREAQAYLAPKSVGFDPYLIDLIKRSHSDERIRPYDLLGQVEPLRLEDTGLQTLFEIALFKTLYISGSGFASSLEKELDSQHDVLLEQAARFIEAGFEYSIRQQSEPKMSLALFCIRVGYLIGHIATYSGKTASEALLKMVGRCQEEFYGLHKQLDSGNATLEQRLQWHLLGTLIHLVALPKGNFATATYHWLCFNELTSRVDVAKRAVWFEDLVAALYIEQLRSNSFDQEQLSTILKQYLGTLPLKGVTGFRRVDQSHTYILSEGSQKWQLNLSLGAVSNDEGVMGGGDTPVWISSRLMEKLCGKTPNYRWSSTTLQIEHPCNDQIDLRVYDACKSSPELWYRRLVLTQNGRSLLYVPNDLLSPLVPLSFLSGHLFFADLQAQELFAFTRTTMKQVGHLERDGKLQVTSLERQGAQQLTYALSRYRPLSCDELEFWAESKAGRYPPFLEEMSKKLKQASYQLEQFEQIDYIEHRLLLSPSSSIDKPSGGALTQIVLPRMKRWQDGRGCSFTETNGQLQYDLDNDYQLLSKPLLGDLHNTLTLFNPQKKDYLVLVPVLLDKESKGDSPKEMAHFDSFLRLKFPDPNDLDLPHSTIRFFEYHAYGPNQLFGNTPEAELWLAALWLSQKQHERCFETLQRLEVNRVAGPGASDLLSSLDQWIKELFERFIDFKDHRPDTTACLVYLASKTAANLARIALDHMSSNKKKWKTLKRVKELYEYYLEIRGYYRELYRCPEKLESTLCTFLSTTTSSLSIEARLDQLEKRPISPVATHSKPAFKQVTLPDSYDHSSSVAFGTIYNYLERCEPLLMSAYTLKSYSSFGLDHLELLQRASCPSHEERRSARAFAHQNIRLSISESDYTTLLHLVHALSRLPEAERDPMHRQVTELIEQARKLPKCSKEETEAKKTELDALLKALFKKLHQIKPEYSRALVHHITPTIGQQQPPQQLPNQKLFQPTSLDIFENPEQIPLSAVTIESFRLQESDLVELPLSASHELAFDLKDARIQDALDREVGEFAEQLQKGNLSLRKRRSLRVDLSKLPSLKERLSHLRSRMAAKSQQLELEWLGLLNRAPECPVGRQMVEAVALGKLKKRVDRRQGCLLLLRNARQAYLRASPYLSAEQIDASHQLAAQWLTAVTEQEHLDRCLVSIERCLDAGQSCPAALSETLDQLLKAERTYLPHEEPMLLVFEHFSKIRLHKSQFELLKKLGAEQNYQDALVQLIMGGGKTSVLATVLGTKAARPGRFSLFITPASQFESVKKNLTQSLRTAFDMELRVLDFTRAQLKVDFLKKLLEEIQTWIRFGYMAISKPECLQFLDLEFISLLEDLAIGRSDNPQLHERVSLLGQILQVLQERTDTLVDEVDLVLHPLLEVNFPRSTPCRIDPLHVELMVQIYRTLVSADCYLQEGAEPITVEQWLGLLENEQEKNFSSEVFFNKALPAIARSLADRCKKRLKLESGDKDYSQAFVDYCSCTLDSEGRSDLPAQNHRQLLEYSERLKQLLASAEPSDTQAAHLAALAKCILRTVLPVTLSRSGGRHYGRTRSVPAGKVVPYVGVDAPATTEFGFYLEALAYHMQTALQFGVEPPQIAHLAQVMLRDAKRQARKRGIRVAKTSVAQAFQQLFDVGLEEVQHSAALNRAAERIKAQWSRQEYETLLLIEAETAIVCQTYYLSRVSSNAHSLKAMFSSFRAFSGTPWNRHTYPLSLQSHFTPDEGSEGQIFQILLEKERAAGRIIHLLDTLSDPLQLLQKTLEDHRSISRFEGLMDPSGVFKGVGNRQVAEAMKKWLIIAREHYSKVKGVLYFQRKEAGQESGEPSSDLLMLLRLDSQEPQELSGTSREALKRYGLEPGEYLVYYDERHTTGTDITQSPNALNLMTYDETLNARSMGQSVMRLRQFFFEQSVEIVLSQATAQKISPSASQELSVKELIAHALLVQAQQKVKISSRGFKQMIDEEFRQFARKLLLRSATSDQPGQDGKALDPTLLENYRHLRALLIQEQDDSPFRNYGPLEQEQPTLTKLHSRIERNRAILQTFLGPSPSQQVIVEIEQLEQRIGEIEALAAQCPLLPTSEVGQDLATGVEQEVEIEIEEEVEQKSEEELALLRELEQYLLPSNPTARHAPQWTEGQFEELIRYAEGKALDAGYPQGAYRDSKGCFCFEQPSAPTVGCIPFAQFITWQSQNKLLKRDFSSVFSDELLATVHFLRSYDQILPIFHPLFFRPENLLAVKTESGSFRLVCLSREEAGPMKEWLRSSRRTHVWMINCQGHLIEEGDRNELSSSNLRQLLAQVHAFLGQVDLLEEDPTSLAHWLEKGVEPKLHLLKLRTLMLPESDQFHRLLANPMLNPGGQKQNLRFLAEQIAADTRFGHLSAAQVQKLSKEELDELADELPEKLAFVSPKQAAQLPVHLLRHLKTAEQLAALEPEKIPSIAPEQVILLKHDWQIRAIGNSTRLLHRLNQEQLPLLNLAQLPLLSRQQVGKLKRIDQLKALGPEQLPFIQSKGLSNQEIRSLLEHLAPSLPSTQAANELSKEQQPYFDLSLRLLLDSWRQHTPFSALSQQQLQAIRTEELGKATRAQLFNHAKQLFLAQLKDTQLGALQDLGLLQALSQERLEKGIGPNQVTYLSDQQIKGLSKEPLIQAVATCNLDRVIQPNQVSKLSDQQLGALGSPTLLQAIPQQRLDQALTLRQVPLLSDQQIGVLAKQTLIQAIPQDRLDSAVQSKQVPLLSDEQLGALQNRPLIQAIPQERLYRVIKPQQVAQLSGEQVWKLSRPLPGLSLQQLTLLRPSAFKQLSQLQKQQLHNEAMRSDLKLEPWQLQQVASDQAPAVGPHTSAPLLPASPSTIGYPQAAMTEPRAQKIEESSAAEPHSSSAPLQPGPSNLGHSEADTTGTRAEDREERSTAARLDDSSFSQLPLSDKLALGYEQLSQRAPQLLGHSAGELEELVEAYPALINHLLPEQVAKVQCEAALRLINQEQSNYLHPTLFKQLSFTQQWKLQLPAQRKLSLLQKGRLALSHLLAGWLHGVSFLFLLVLLLPLIWIKSVRQQIGKQGSAAIKLSWALRIWF